MKQTVMTEGESINLGSRGTGMDLVVTYRGGEYIFIHGDKETGRRAELPQAMLDAIAEAKTMEAAKADIEATPLPNGKRERLSW